MKGQLVVFSILAIILAVGTNIYLQSLEYPGVDISLIGASFVIKSMMKNVGPKTKIIEGLMPKLKQPVVETESLRIETIAVTFDTANSELYLKEVGESTANYSFRVYQPKTFKEGGYPILMYIHGGGWMYGSIEMYNELCTEVAKKGFLVVSIDYRRTPEHIYPSCLNDNVNALSWIGKNHAKYNGNINQLIISGDSAGGHLSITTQLRLFSLSKEVLERESIPTITHQALIYPVADYYRYGDEKHSSYVKYRDNGLIIDGFIMDMFWQHFIGNMTAQQVKSNPLLSPVSAFESVGASLYSQFPKGFVWLAELDVLRDEGESFAKIVNSLSPNKLTVKEWKKLPHGFVSIKRSHNQLADSIHELLKQ